MDTIQCEVRFQQDAAQQGPGRLVGVLMTYEKRASDRREIFKRGALRFPPGGIIINEQHQRGQPILRAVPIVDGDTVRIDAMLPDTQRGRDAATNLKEGVLTGLSVEMYPEAETMQNGIRVIQRAFAPRAGLVDDPSYSDSTAEVRNQDQAKRLLVARLYL